MAVTNAVSWRSDGIKYRKNQIFVDVMEHINYGTVLSCDINGVIKCDCQLSGMPELRMGFNDMLAVNNVSSSKKITNNGTKVELEDTKFHQCVRLASFENERKISFIPPDGKFDLMSYRIPFSGQPPFLVSQNYSVLNTSRVKFNVRIISTFKKNVVANIVDVNIPVHPDFVNPKFSMSHGNCNYVPELNIIKWNIKSFTGQKESEINVEFNLPTINQGCDIKTPISIDFEINYYAASRIQIRYMKVSEKSGYEAFPWARYVTFNGNYQVRAA